MAGCACRGFIAVDKRGRNTVKATTPELNALNARHADAAADCLTLTQQVRADPKLPKP